MKNTSKTFILAALAATLVAPVAASASWKSTHPARAAINARLANQNRRITAERKEGEITGAQAHALRADDHSIRAQERADAAADANHGHLDKQQIKSLNQELNANSGAIGK